VRANLVTVVYQMEKELARMSVTAALRIPFVTKTGAAVKMEGLAQTMTHAALDSAVGVQKVKRNANRVIRFVVSVLQEKIAAQKN